MKGICFGENIDRKILPKEAFLCLHVKSEIRSKFLFFFSIKEKELGLASLFFHKPGVGLWDRSVRLRVLGK